MICPKKLQWQVGCIYNFDGALYETQSEHCILQNQKSLVKDGDIKNNDDETLLIINKSKHPKKGECKKQNGRTHVQKDKKSTKKGEPQREHQVLEPLLVTRSISNKERGGPLERTPNIEGLSSTAIAHFKIETTYTSCNTSINVRKIDRGGLPMPFVPHAMLAH